MIVTCLNTVIGCPPGSLALLLEPDPGEHPVQALLRRQGHTFFRKRPRVLIEGHDVDLEIEPARPDELLESLERGVDRAAFDPGHERLGHAGARRQRALRKTRSAASLPNELSGIHGSKYTG